MIGFCTSIKNRLWQLKQTLPHNIKVLGDHYHITIADLGSDDGLKDYVFDTFYIEMAEGKLLYFCADRDVPWSMPVAKNLSHRLSPAQYLFSLDADNYITKTDVLHIKACAEKKIGCHQFSGEFGDGSHGRIGIASEEYYDIGGYNEALLPMGFQDTDLLLRLGHYEKLPAPEKKAVQNNDNQKMVNVGNAAVGYERMNAFNSRYSSFNRRILGRKLRLGFSSFRGHLNNEPLEITGLDTPEDLLMKSKYIRMAKARGNV